MRIFLHGIYMLLLSICSQEGIFYFQIPRKVFRDLLQRSQFEFDFVDNSNHLNDLITIQWQCPYPMLRQWSSQSFSQFIRPNNFKLSVYQTNDFKTPSGDYDKWRVIGKNESKNKFCTHHISCVDPFLSFHKLQCIHFWSTSVSKPKDTKQD